MKLYFLDRYCERRKYRNIRGILRGYRLLKASGRLGLIRKVKREFGDTKIEAVTSVADAFFFGAAVREAELVTRQFLLLRNAGIVLHKTLLYSIGTGNTSIVCPLPKEFRRVLVNNGFKVCQWRSTAAWASNIFLLWCFGIVTVIKYVCCGLRRIVSTVPWPAVRYAYFVGLESNNLPRPRKDGKSYDTVTWYSRWKDAANGLDALYHQCTGVPVSMINGMEVSFRREPFPALADVFVLFRFLLWASGAIGWSAFDMCRGRWWYAFLLSETTRAAVTRLANPAELAVDYLFANSDSVYRPVWTYEAKLLGSRIVSYFYSIFEDFKLPSGYQANSTYWQAMNWPVYAVWDDHQKQLIKRNIRNYADVVVAGPIWLSSSPEELPEIPHTSIAVFDTPAKKVSLHFGFSTIAELYDSANVPIAFVRDIARALEKYGITIIYKGKRKKAVQDLHKGYIRVLKNLVEENKMVIIDADTSPMAVIEKCKAVISMPFTSTAIIGRELGKPSVYYDSSGLIQKDDRGAHGILVVSSEGELQNWIKTVFSPE